jgi:hypothetical protein
MGAVRDIEQGRAAVPRPGSLARLTAALELGERELAYERTPGIRDELAFDSQEKNRNYKNPLTGWCFALLGR